MKILSLYLRVGFEDFIWAEIWFGWKNISSIYPSQATLPSKGIITKPTDLFKASFKKSKIPLDRSMITKKDFEQQKKRLLGQI